MKRLIFLSLLATGCAAQQERQALQAQQEQAAIAYLSAMCEKEGFQRDSMALKGCVIAKVQRLQAMQSLGGPNVLQGMGSVYLEAGRAPQPRTCSTRPDMSGGWITTCP